MLYAQRFLDKRHPKNTTIQNVTQRAREYNENDARDVTVLLMVYLDSHVSTRQTEREIGITQSTYSRILRALNYQPHHNSNIKVDTNGLCK